MKLKMIKVASTGEFSWRKEYGEIIKLYNKLKNKRNNQSIQKLFLFYVKNPFHAEVGISKYIRIFGERPGKEGMKQESIHFKHFIYSNRHSNKISSKHLRGC